MKSIGMSKLALLVGALLAIASPTSEAQNKRKAAPAQTEGSALGSTDLDSAEAAAKALGASKSPKAVDTLLDAPWFDEQQTREYLRLIAKENMRLSRVIESWRGLATVTRRGISRLDTRETCGATSGSCDRT